MLRGLGLTCTSVLLLGPLGVAGAPTHVLQLDDFKAEAEASRAGQLQKGTYGLRHPTHDAPADQKAARAASVKHVAGAGAKHTHANVSTFT